MTGKAEVTNKPTNLSKRRREAARSATFAKVEDDGRVTVPGHNGERYIVKVNRRNARNTTMSCWKVSNGKPCSGMNKTHTLCYHAIAAIIKLAELRENNVSFCADEASARNVAKLNSGKVIHVLNSFNALAEMIVVVSASDAKVKRLTKEAVLRELTEKSLERERKAAMLVTGMVTVDQLAAYIAQQHNVTIATHAEMVEATSG